MIRKRQALVKTVLLATVVYLQMGTILYLIASSSDMLGAQERALPSQLLEEEMSKGQELLQQNDLVSVKVIFQLQLSDRILDVVQSVDNQDYLIRNPAGEYDKLGTLFVDKDYKEGAYNIVIYGHSFRNSKERLSRLKERAYILENQVFSILENEVKKDYQIIAYFNSELPERDIAYFNTSFRNMGSYHEFLQKAQNASLHSFNCDIKAVEHSLTLITCDLSSEKERRWVVVAVPL